MVTWLLHGPLVLFLFPSWIYGALSSFYDIGSGQCLVLLSQLMVRLPWNGKLDHYKKYSPDCSLFGLRQILVCIHFLLQREMEIVITCKLKAILFKHMIASFQNYIYFLYVQSTWKCSCLVIYGVHGDRSLYLCYYLLPLNDLHFACQKLLH